MNFKRISIIVSIISLLCTNFDTDTKQLDVVNKKHSIKDPKPPYSLCNATKVLIRQHEGYREKVYLDSTGTPTIGIGFNLHRKDAPSKIGQHYTLVLNGQKALTKKQIEILFHNDVTIAICQAKQNIDHFNSLPQKIQEVIVNMIYNMGITKFNYFVKFKKAIYNKNYEKAALEMIDSKWYNQVGNRSKELVAIVRSLK